MKVMAIQAEEVDGKWRWVNWFTLHFIAESEYGRLKTPEDFKQWFIREGLALEDSEDMYEIHDDGSNMVLKLTKNGRPVFAIEYNHG